MYSETESDYVRVAPRHVADAYKLLEPSSSDGTPADATTRHLAGARYIAGYAVECALKAYLINYTATGSFSEARAALKKRGVDVYAGFVHELTRLLNASNLDTSADPAIASQFGICAVWTTDWRYDPNISLTETDARDFVDAASAIRQWVERQRIANGGSAFT